MQKTSDRVPFQPSLSVVRDTFGEIRELVASQMRGAALELVHGLFREEVERLCGPAFSHKADGTCHRGGSDPGSVKLQGQSVSVKKPRVKRDGEEVPLESYRALQSFDLLCDKVMRHMITGVSTRNYEPLLDEVAGSTGLKKSSVSKAFVSGSLAALDEINGRSLGDHEWLAVMIDSVHFANRAVIVALGITSAGKKLVLGLREGTSENAEVVKDLLESLLERGMSRDQKFLFVLDGGKALRKGVRQVFGEDFPVQRCVRHKERNVLEYLPRRHHGEFRRRWKLIHGQASYAGALAEYEKLVRWPGDINHEAQASLEEAERETLTAIKLEAGPKLRKTLLSTNPIESIFDGVRAKTRRVKNWKGKKQISRWAASALLEGEKKLRTVRGHGEIRALLDLLKQNRLQSEGQAA
jgi:transposase-like protein